jgi:hypothetical protein
MPHVLSDLPERIAAALRVDPVTGCWRWQLAKTPKGYGAAWWDGKYWRAHRLVWVLCGNAIPGDKPQLDHVRARGCLYRDCCLPDHLEPVTNIENLERGDWRRWHSAYWGGRPHCPKGHPLVPGNLRGGKRLARGHRECLTCHRERERARGSRRSG